MTQNGKIQWREYLGDRHFYQQILQLAIPVSLQQLITVGINLMDTIMLSSMGGRPAIRVFFGQPVYQHLSNLLYGPGNGGFGAYFPVLGDAG